MKRTLDACRARRRRPWTAQSFKSRMVNVLETFARDETAAALYPDAPNKARARRARICSAVYYIHLSLSLSLWLLLLRRRRRLSCGRRRRLRFDFFTSSERERERGRQRTRRNYRFVGAAKNIGEKFGSFLRARWWEYVVFVILYRWRELFSRGKIYFELLVVRSGKGVIWGFMRSVIIVIEWVVTGLATKVYAHIMK